MDGWFFVKMNEPRYAGTDYDLVLKVLSVKTPVSYVLGFSLEDLRSVDVYRFTGPKNFNEFSYPYHKVVDIFFDGNARRVLDFVLKEDYAHFSTCIDSIQPSLAPSGVSR